MEHTLVSLRHLDFTTTDRRLRDMIDWLQMNVGEIALPHLQYPSDVYGSYISKDLPWFWTATFNSNTGVACDVRFFILNPNHALQFRLMWG